MPNNIGLLSSRVKKTPATNASADRYQYLDLENAEPDLGVPEYKDGVAASETNGIRKWLYWSDDLIIDDNNFIRINPVTLSGTVSNIDGGFY